MGFHKFCVSWIRRNLSLDTQQTFLSRIPSFLALRLSCYLRLGYRTIVGIHSSRDGVGQWEREWINKCLQFDSPRRLFLFFPRPTLMRVTNYRWQLYHILPGFISCLLHHFLGLLPEWGLCRPAIALHCETLVAGVWGLSKTKSLPGCFYHPHWGLPTVHVGELRVSFS